LKPGWRSSTAEQLICNQQVVGSNPIASSSQQVSEWLKPESDTDSNRIRNKNGVKGNKERFPSGQREQTVNLPAMPSKVRILPSPPFLIAGIAQLVERKPSKLGVAGSSPVSRSNLHIADGHLAGPITSSNEESGPAIRRCAQVAQSVEHVLGKDEVGGSIPLLGFA
jgi:hypothetical protein